MIKKPPPCLLLKLILRGLQEKLKKKKEKVATNLLHIKVKVQGVKALAEQKRETNLREWEELLKRIEEDAVEQPPKKTRRVEKVEKKTPRQQVTKRREEKAKKVDNGIYFQMRSSKLLGVPIRAFKWKKLLEGVFNERVDVVNLFYKGFIHSK
ncbi:hypothetical protein E5676_scaffold2750G00230 [Cucumis melo var. makuwa]|uniref:Protein MNN4-like n=1 Tax=Cucumis melo var. makuwa TaxID=1194695 RepID=A0A5A7UF62_CUCMM|nr:hypothetical protein E6C27_scaffold24G001480 [Cucumis melo var. makuwa]TYJ96829.1 hypothetical protein E5676_scaffold2750G00230 [Cucumis melo var. makuwa]